MTKPVQVQPSPSPLSGKKHTATDADTNAANMTLHSDAKVPAINNTEKADLKELNCESTVWNKRRHEERRETALLSIVTVY